MHTPLPKQFMPLNGKPVLAYSIEAFYKSDPGTEIIAVLPENFISQWHELAQQSHLSVPHHIIKGGRERFYSVLNALNGIHDTQGLVAIHDAARPFVSLRLINETYMQASVNGCAIPAIPVKDSIRAYSMGEWVPADRGAYRCIQTPQTFSLHELKHAYHQTYTPGFTDDATVWESAGNRVHLIEGEEVNFKITTFSDMDYAQYLAEKERLS